jgi:hypothetical protein
MLDSPCLLYNHSLAYYICLKEEKLLDSFDLATSSPLPEVRMENACVVQTKKGAK